MRGFFQKSASPEGGLVIKKEAKGKDPPPHESSDDTNRIMSAKDSETSLDTSPNVHNSLSAVGSSETRSTLKVFGLSNHLGKSVDDFTIDPFMDIGNTSQKNTNRNSSKPKISKDDSLQYLDKYNQALSCIRFRDFDQLLKIVEATPEILLYQCKKNGVDIQQQSNENIQLLGNYGGTILHELVSQKPMLKKKRCKNNDHPIKDRVKKAFSFSVRNSTKLEVMEYVPHSVIKHIIKLAPEALLVKDDFGRLPIHACILSQSAHLEEVNNEYGTIEGSVTRKFCRDISFVVNEVNLVQILIKYNPSTVTVGDLRGNTPLHYAVSIGRDYFEGNHIIFKKSDKYRMPSACETIRLILEANPRSVTLHNAQRNLPIHHMIAMKGPAINLSSLKLMMNSHRLCKDVLKERNKDGDTSLILAIKSRASIDAIKMFAAVDGGTSSSSKLFAQRDGNNNNPLHVALTLSPRVNPEFLRTILHLAPFTACEPDSRNMMPIRYATSQDLPEDIIRQMLAMDMPIKIGSQGYSSERSKFGIARHVVAKSHHSSFWHIVVECDDKYLSMIKTFLMEEASHSQIVTLARQIGPDGNSILINCVSDKCRLVFHSLLRFYDRYEILLSSKSSKDVKVKHDEILDGVQSFLALDHGLSTELPTEKCFSNLYKTFSDLSTSSERSISTAVRVQNEKSNQAEVEVSLLSKEKCKVVLRCYEYEEAFFAEVKVREKYDFPRQYYEELYNYHRDETYTFLNLSRREKLCCITFERPEHTLAEVFASISSGGQRSQQWIEKCWIVLKQLATALKYLHNQNLIHGHLDAQNIAKYGNIWKIGKLGTVAEIGSIMRGKFRPCVPPESIFESDPAAIGSISMNLNVQEEESNLMRLGTGHRVKFSHSSEECNLDQTKAQADCRNDVDAVSTREIQARQGPFLTFFGFTGRSLDSRNHEVSSNAQLAIKKNEGQPKLFFLPERCKASVQFDMWGFGLLMVQLLLGRCMLLPNFEKAEDAVLKKLFNYDLSTLNKLCNQLRAVAGNDAADLVMSLLQKDPNHRPKSMEDVMAHKYFQVLTIYV